MGSLQGRPPARHQVWTHFQARARMLHCTGRQAVRLTPLREYAAACHPVWGGHVVHVYMCAVQVMPPPSEMCSRFGVRGEGHDVCIHILSCANDASPLVEDVQQNWCLLRRAGQLQFACCAVQGSVPHPFHKMCSRLASR